MADNPYSSLKVDLSGQTAIVTGASRGIGRAIAQALARCGAKVACVARSEDKLKETVDAIAAAGGTAIALACDVTQRASVDPVVEKVVEQWGKLDILVRSPSLRWTRYSQETPESFRS